jgi:hypothetical protein
MAYLSLATKITIFEITADLILSVAAGRGKKNWLYIINPENMRIVDSS